MTAYYNENDPKAAAWLRELIKARLISKGEVDERSIVDVRGSDLAGFTRCHFFAGIGGWDYALRLAGWPADEPVWTGSCPCQPFSQAGKGKGESDSRHLWPDLLRLIEECRPARVFGEQVASKAGRRWLDGVRTDLGALDHEVGAADLCSPGVGAPHIRQRLYWVADAGHERTRRAARSSEEAGGWPLSDASGRGIDCPHCNGTGRFQNGNKCYCCDGRGWRDFGGLDNSAESRRAGERFSGADSAPRDEARMRESPRSGPSLRLGDSHDSRSQGRRIDAGEYADQCAAGEAGATGGMGNANSPGCETQRSVSIGARSRPEQSADSSSPRRMAVSDGREPGDGRVQRGREQRFQPQDSRTGFWSDFDIVYCADDKARRIEPGTFPLAHGIPARMGRLRGYGNAINPWLTAEFVMAYKSLAQGLQPEPAAGNERGY